MHLRRAVAWISLVIQPPTTYTMVLDNKGGRRDSIGKQRWMHGDQIHTLFYEVFFVSLEDNQSILEVKVSQ